MGTRLTIVAESNEASPTEEHESQIESSKDDGISCNALAMDEEVLSARRASVTQRNFVEAVDGPIVLCFVYRTVLELWPAQEGNDESKVINRNNNC